MKLGKWILGVLGFTMGGPIGAILGALLGTAIDNAVVITDSRTYTGGDSPWGTSSTQPRATAGDIRVSILILIACVMKADGRLLKSELDHVKAFLRANYDEAGAKQALQMLKELLKKDIDCASVSRQIGQYVDYSTRLEILHMLLDLANVDGDFDTREEAVIEQIAAGMNISASDLDSLKALYQKSKDADWAYRALGIERSATDDEVKKAYRAMALKYHPDKVGGAGEEVVKNATEKFRAVNEAYEAIKAERGFK